MHYSGKHLLLNVMQCNLPSANLSTREDPIGLEQDYRTRQWVRSGHQTNPLIKLHFTLYRWPMCRPIVEWVYRWRPISGGLWWGWRPWGWRPWKLQKCFVFDGLCPSDTSWVKFCSPIRSTLLCTYIDKQCKNSMDIGENPLMPCLFCLGPICWCKIMPTHHQDIYHGSLFNKTQKYSSHHLNVQPYMSHIWGHYLKSTTLWCVSPMIGLIID